MDNLMSISQAKNNSTDNEGQYQVLLVEDDLAHSTLISRSFEMHKQYQLLTMHTLGEVSNVN